MHGWTTVTNNDGTRTWSYELLNYSIGIAKTNRGFVYTIAEETNCEWNFIADSTKHPFEHLRLCVDSVFTALSLHIHDKLKRAKDTFPIGDLNNNG